MHNHSVNIDNANIKKRIRFLWSEKVSNSHIIIGKNGALRLVLRDFGASLIIAIAT
jgi:hypothetical protein